MPVPTVVISRRGAERLSTGHPWIYRSDVRSAEAEPGDFVEVRSERGRPLGIAMWSDTSQIALRWTGTRRTRGTAGTAGSGTAGTTGSGTTGTVPDDEIWFDERGWFRDRLEAAVEYRAALDIDATAYRLVHAEGDGIPGLVVDRYGDVLVMQTLCQATDRRLALIRDLLVELTAPAGILARNDAKVRRFEGLDETVEVVAGEVPEASTVTLGGRAFEVDLRRGQKTGLFLDQRENWVAAGRYARGRGLDAFTYHGGFALHLAGGCEAVLALDSSGPAVEATRANAVRNGLANIEVREANVFDELRELEIAHERFDTIVLDPPAFAKHRASVDRAVAGYKEINLRALKLLQPGGHLISCSCSYHVDEPLLLGIIQQAAADAHADVMLVEKRLQARDHPVRLNVPETAYLKCLVLRRAR